MQKWANEDINGRGLYPNTIKKKVKDENETAQTIIANKVKFI